MKTMKILKRKKAKRFGAGRRRLVGILGVVFLAVSLATGSTFAWYMASDTVVNELRNKQVGDVVIAEKFVEPKKWLPGQKIVKEVGVLNLSKHEVLVRIGFEELLEKYADEIQALKIPWTPSVRILPWNDPGLLHETVPVTLAFDPLDSYTNLKGWYLYNDPSMNLKLGPSVNLQGATLMVRKIEHTLSDASEPSAGYQFVLWYDLPAPGAYAGQAQRVTADLYLDTDGETILLAPDTLRFYVYPPMLSSKAAWADLLDSKLFAVPVVHPSAADAGHSALDAAILFGFDGLYVLPLDPPTTLTDLKDKWVYNPEDGYFYYIGKLAPAAASSLLLTDVTLSAGADNSHEDLKYSLWVNSEAIQNYETAMKAGNGWGMKVPSAYTDTIVAALLAAGALALP